MNAILAVVLQQFLGFLGQLILAFVSNLAAARMDDPALASVIAAIVEGIQHDHPEWSNDQKWEYAFKAAKEYAQSVGKEARDSLINTLIELSVQRLKSAKPA
jgi:hypothetical protein